MWLVKAAFAAVVKGADDADMDDMVDDGGGVGGNPPAVLVSSND